MHKTWISFQFFAGRFKLVAALLAVFGSGALIAVGISAHYYDAALTRQQGAYERQIARLESELLIERDVNRGRIEAVANDIDSIVDSIGRLITMIQAASKTVGAAASTAKAAAATARSAAKNAAKANITITETPPPAPEPVNPFPERIEP